MTTRYAVLPCQGAFVVADIAAQVREEAAPHAALAGCLLVADGPFATYEAARARIATLLARAAAPSAA